MATLIVRIVAHRRRNEDEEAGAPVARTAFPGLAIYGSVPVNGIATT